MKRLVIISGLLVCLILGMALPAFAASDSTRAEPSVLFQMEKEKRKPPELSPVIPRMKVIKGEVTAVSNISITIGDTEVFVDENTRYHIPALNKPTTAAGIKGGTLADIQVGMLVTAMVVEKDGKPYARQIVVLPSRPVLKHHVGKVTEYSYDPATGGSITIEDKDGESFTFEILAGKFKILPPGAEVKVGETVTVISRRDPAQSKLIADGVVVQKPITTPKPTPRPKMERVSGEITAIDETAKTITIGDKVLTYDAETLFVLRGSLAVAAGQSALAYYVEKDGTLLVQKVLIGVDITRVQAALGNTAGEDN